MFCQKCGNHLDDDAKFCEKCGAPVNAAPAETGEAPAQNPAPAPAPQGEKDEFFIDLPAAAPAYQPNPQYQPPYQPTQPQQNQPYQQPNPQYQQYQQYQQPYQQNPQYNYGQQPVNKTNTLSIVGFILSFFVAIAGLICSIIGLKQCKQTGEGGKGLATAGIIISAVSMAITFIVSIVSISVYGSLLGSIYGVLL